jgi:hypothetical protein
MFSTEQLTSVKVSFLQVSNVENSIKKYIRPEKLKENNFLAIVAKIYA